MHLKLRADHGEICSDHTHHGPEIELPDDVEALNAMVLAMAEKAARVEALEK